MPKLQPVLVQSGAAGVERQVRCRSRLIVQLVPVQSSENRLCEPSGVGPSGMREAPAPMLSPPQVRFLIDGVRAVLGGHRRCQPERCRTKSTFPVALRGRRPRRCIRRCRTDRCRPRSRRWTTPRRTARRRLDRPVTAPRGRIVVVVTGAVVGGSRRRRCRRGGGGGADVDVLHHERARQATRHRGRAGRPTTSTSPLPVAAMQNTDASVAVAGPPS